LFSHQFVFTPLYFYLPLRLTLEKFLMEAPSTTSSATNSVDGRSVGGGGASDYLNMGMFASSNSSSNVTGSGGGGDGDLLVGGFGLGNGFGNDTSSSLVANNTSGATGTSFDLSDFPSLGGTSSNNGLAAALRQQQQLLGLHPQMFPGAQQQQQQQQQQQAKQQPGGPNLYRLAMTGANGNFTMATEDFPALPGSAGGVNGSSLLGGSATTTTGARAAASTTGLYGEIESNNTQLEGGTAFLSGGGLGGLGGLRGLQQSSTNLATSLQRVPAPASAAVGSNAGTSSATAGSALSGDYGLLGLLGVIRMTDADRNALALGSDLTMLGLNLGTTEQIYSTFSSPWSDNLSAKEPHYQVG
jgi:CCR4-NOT transcription complex subunit 2